MSFMQVASEESTMSVRGLLWVAVLRGITVTERSVLQKLAHHAGSKSNAAWPAVNEIAEWGNLTPRQVRRVLSRLTQRQLIQVDPAKGRRGGSQPSLYTLQIPTSFDPRTCQRIDVPPVPSNAAEPDVFDRDPGHFRHPTPDIFDTRPPSKMSAEPVKRTDQENRSVLTHRAAGRPPSENQAANASRKTAQSEIRRRLWHEGAAWLVEAGVRRNRWEAQYLLRGLLDLADAGRDPHRVAAAVEAARQADLAEPSELEGFLIAWCSGQDGAVQH